MIEAFRIGVQMTMDAADTQSVVHLLARDFTALNQQIMQTQSGLAAMRAGLADLGGQRTALEREQEVLQQSAIWQANAAPAQAAVAQSPQWPTEAVARLSPDGSAGGDVRRPVDRHSPDELSLRPWPRAADPDLASAILPALATLLNRREQSPNWMADQRPEVVTVAAPAEAGGGFPAIRTVSDPALSAWLPSPDVETQDSMVSGDFAAWPSGHATSQDSATPLIAGAQQSSQPGETDLRAVASGIAALTATVAADRTLPDLRAGLVLPAPPNPFAWPPEPGLARRAGEADDTPTSSAKPDRGPAEPVPPLVIHTDLHLDGQVIARAVTQQIVDWMNAPLPGAGGFDPRRSYTPVES